MVMRKITENIWFNHDIHMAKNIKLIQVRSSSGTGNYNNDSQCNFKDIGPVFLNNLYMVGNDLIAAVIEVGRPA
ncbi:hypothetical protein N7453_011326 [Penicillium expansum]|nr:hypothetical protein N7453_011326 [Penicillium expansum]